MPAVHAHRREHVAYHLARLGQRTAALEAWDYCDRSAQYIFGGQLGDMVADDLLPQLRAWH